MLFMAIQVLNFCIRRALHLYLPLRHTLSSLPDVWIELLFPHIILHFHDIPSPAQYIVEFLYVLTN